MTALHTLQARAADAARAERRHRACIMAVDLMIGAAIALLATVVLGGIVRDGITSIAADTAATYALACERGADCR